MDLVDRGIIRVLDLAFIHKDDGGTVHRQQLADLGPEVAVFEGAAANFLAQEDVDNAAGAIQPDSTAFLLIYENRWAAQTGSRDAARRWSARSHRPPQGILAALDASAEHDV